MVAPKLRHSLTAGQARLLARHRAGLVRVARVFSGKLCREPSEIILLLAHKAGRVGEAAREHLDMRVATDVIVIPGLVRDLPRWISQLALGGPVYDFTTPDTGVVVIVIDEHGEMAVVGIPCPVTAATSEGQNSKVTFPEGADPAGI